MDTEDFSEDSNLVRDLRKQLKDALASKKQFEDELGSLRGAFREKTVAELLQAKGVNPKVAKFVPPEVEGEESLTDWLSEFGDVFGATTAPSEQPPPVPAETTREWARAGALVAGSLTPDKVSDLQSRIGSAGSVAEINAALSEFQKFQL